MNLRFYTKISVFLLLSFFLWQEKISAQATFSDLNRDVLLPIEKLSNSTSADLHSNIKPFLMSDLKVLETDTSTKAITNSTERGSINISISSDVDLIKLKSKKIIITLNPLLTVLPGYELSNSKSILDTRLGGKLNVEAGKKLALEFQLINTNANFPDYWNLFTKSKGIIQGAGLAYKSSLGYTNLQANGYASYSPNSYFNFQAGRGKNFFGDGYRSLLLSDVSNNYNYLKITTSIWKIKYVNLFTSLKAPKDSFQLYNSFKNKYASIHYLSWNATKRINVSFFESIVWQSRATGNKFGYDVNYANPIIFYRPTEYSLGSSDNALIGASFRVKLFQHQQLYGQILIDEFLLSQVRAFNGWWANKQGFQLGFKSFDCFKIENLYFQTELNYVRPYTYSHSNSYQNYGHFNESLAHPLGANFSEIFMNVNYKKNRWLFDIKVTYASVGLDSAGRNYGQNIYASNLTRVKEFGNETGQGIKTVIATTHISTSYLLNTKYNLRVELGVAERLQKNTVITQNTNYIYFGLLTTLGNFYSDF